MASPNSQPQAYSATSGSPTNSHRPNPPAHTRTYQACIPCRRRKVRCDLGPVDNPHDPPCVRCRRESKECFFSNTRRKRRNSDDEEVYVDDNGDDYEARNGRKRVRGDSIASPFGDGPRRPHALNINAANNMSQYGHGTQLPPLTPGGSIGRSQPLRRPNDPQPEHREEDVKVNNETAAILQTKEVYSGHDALNLLFEAAGRNGDIAHHRTISNTSTNRPTLTPGSTSTAPASYVNHRFNGNVVNSPAQDRNVNSAAGSATANGLIKEDSQDDPGFQQAVKAWQRFRFVRAGWFTAREGIMYIRYFFKYLSPLTPVVVPNFEEYPTHKKMLEDEPMLVVTLLTIASRYMTLSGPGSSSRPYAIHQKLWCYLQGMIDRLLWGQEQFGGGFCGAGAQQNSDVNPVTRKGLRTLGTVESLLLLMEWHPRSMHFPPGENDDELMIPENLDADASNGPAANSMLVEGHGGQRLDSWLEPCWRSDRVCWMLIGNAITLATEIGVFDENFDLNADGTSQDVSREQTTAYLRRRNHLKQLLAVYLLQTAGRQGLISMLPQIQRDVKKGDDILNTTRIGGLLSSPQFQSSQLVSGHMQQGQDTVLALWISVAKIMELGNQKLFPNRNATRHLIKSGKYLEQLQFFGPITKQWREEFEKSRPLLTPLMQHILEIEFEYSRVYLNALALQAVVERCANNTPLQTNAHPHSNGNSSIKTDGGVIPPSTLMKWSGADRPYIHQVIDAARNVLRVVIDGLYPSEYLKHAPVRTFFRIISVAIILLKTFALGATEDDVAISLSLMHGAVEKLRTSIVDDVHVGTRFADLLETLTNRIRSRFVRMSGTGAPSRATSRSPAPSVYQTNGSSQMLPPPNHHSHQASQWSNSGDFMSSPLMSRGQQTPNSNGALWGISTESYDPGSSNVSIMPPPTYSNGNFGHNAAMNNHTFGVNGTGGMGMTDQDWLALPLDPLIASYGMDVNGSAYGPVVGDYDILDLLLDPTPGQ